MILCLLKLSQEQKDSMLWGLILKNSISEIECLIDSGVNQRIISVCIFSTSDEYNKVLLVDVIVVVIGKPNPRNISGSRFFNIQFSISFLVSSENTNPLIPFPPIVVVVLDITSYV